MIDQDDDRREWYVSQEATDERVQRAVEQLDVGGE
jgi:hypothetical protein